MAEGTSAGKGSPLLSFHAFSQLRLLQQHPLHGSAAGGFPGQEHFWEPSEATNAILHPSGAHVLCCWVPADASLQLKACHQLGLGTWTRMQLRWVLRHCWTCSQPRQGDTAPLRQGGWQVPRHRGRASFQGRNNNHQACFFLEMVNAEQQCSQIWLQEGNKRPSCCQIIFN